MVLGTEKIADAYTAALDPVRADQNGPLLVTVPSTGGSAAGKDRITRYIREAVRYKNLRQGGKPNDRTQDPCRAVPQVDPRPKASASAPPSAARRTPR